MSGNAKQQDLGIRPERVEQAALGCELIALVPVAGNHHHGKCDRRAGHVDPFE